VYLETPKQLAKRTGISERQIRSLISSGQLEYVKIGCRVHITDGAFERFIEQNKVTPCQRETVAQSCNGLQIEAPGTSHGQSTVAAVSAQRTRQIAQQLKQSSPKKSTSEESAPAQVIPLRA
jgi:excisionase family DNA binding protein